VSEITDARQFLSLGLLSGDQSLLMENMSYGEGDFLSELNQAFAKKPHDSNQRD
jgi:hypothetical protein